MDELLSGTAPYRFTPESYKKVLNLSYEIFEQAKDAYFDGEVSVQEAEQKLEEIMAFGKEIESHEYKYRDKSEIICDYEAELSECILDVDTIRGGRFIQSLRFGNYIDDINAEAAISEIQEVLDFSNTNIFKMPDKLF